MAPGQPTRQLLRDLAVCVSLANLLWLEPWRLALDIRWNPFFFTRSTQIHLFSVTGGVVLTAMILWGGLVATRSYARFRGIGIGAFLLLSAIAANTLRTQIPALSTPNLVAVVGVPGLSAMAALILAVMSLALMFRLELLVRSFRVVLIMFGPFALYTFFQAGEAALSELTLPQDRASEPLAAPRPGPRVVLVLFDEMDRTHLALHTAAGAGMLPALAAVAAQGVDFQAALAPAGARTLISLPSITTGRTVIESEPDGPQDVQIRFSNGEKAHWSESPNFFRTARSEGVDVFLAGWFIPYCRLFASDLSSCTWRSAYPARPESFTQSMSLYARLFWRSIPALNRLSLWAGWRRPEFPGLAWHMESLREVHARALQGAPDPKYRLVFLHYPVPHLSPDFQGDLIQNQILADGALGELREAMKASGMWDSTALVVMSDHGYRALPGTRRPTLIVKPPLSTAPVAVSREVKLERVYDLVLGLLRGQVQTPADVVTVMAGTQ